MSCIAVYKQPSNDFRTEYSAMLKLVVCIIILTAVRCAQEHLICLRTVGVFNQQSPQTLQSSLQGPPGKPGVKGQVGSRGRPGQKGEPGIPDDRQIVLLRDQYDSLSQEINALKNKTRENQQNELINSLSQEVEALRNQSRMNRQLVVDVFSKGLYVPPHVYIYRLTPGRQSWQKSQEFCQSWGGDLAMHGVKTLENRKTLIQNLSIKNIYFWIGANDIASEGNWTWVDGERASSSELIWSKGEPNNRRGDEDCGAAHGYPTFSFVGTAFDQSCAYLFQALCEKHI